MREYFRIFMLGGPVGLAYVVRLAWVQHRMRRVRTWMDREKETHRAHMAALNAELNSLIGRQQSTNIAAAQFRAYCDKTAGGKA